MSEKIIKLKTKSSSKIMETVTLHFTAQDKLALKLVALAEGKSLKSMLERFALNYLIQIADDADHFDNVDKGGDLTVKYADENTEFAELVPIK